MTGATHRPVREWTPPPEANPDTPQWRGLDELPPKPGRYKWRLTHQWEDIEREIDVRGRVYSHRFLNWVPALKVGGYWFF